MSADVLAKAPTIRDFARLGAAVTLERYRVDPQALWAPDEVTDPLWNCRNLMPFRSLTLMAMRMASDLRFKSPGAILMAAAGVIEP